MDSGHHADVPMLFGLLTRRLESHCTKLVALAAEASANSPIYPLQTFPAPLQEDLDAHRTFAFNRCMHSMASIGGVFTFPRHDGTLAPAPGEKRGREGPSGPWQTPTSADPTPSKRPRNSADRVPPRREAAVWRGLCTRCHEPGYTHAKCTRGGGWATTPDRAPQSYKDFCERMRVRARAAPRQSPAHPKREG